jgi:hypothetical protein
MIEREQQKRNKRDFPKTGTGAICPSNTSGNTQEKRPSLSTVQSW